jgi:hypothetical protein
VPPLRFPRRSLFWLVVFLGMLIALPAVPLLGSFTFLIKPPLQGCYLRAYMESAELFRQNSATTPIVWLYKIAPGRRHTLLTERDVQATNSGTLGLRLSSAPLGDGWTGIEAGAQERVNSTELHAFLRANIYNGHSYEWIVAEPLVLGFLGVAALAGVMIAIRRKSNASRHHEERQWTEDQGS